MNYQYFDDSKLKLVGLNGATTGANVLATYYDDQLGRRTSMCRGTGTTSSCSSVARTTYSYDPLSRLSGLAHDLITGTSANDASWTLAYSPASQLTSRSASSALYEWPYSATFSDAYTVNGLNQYTAVAGASLAYDGRGNTTNDTTKTYTYDSSNMLMSASNGAALTYDPTGRLLSIAQGGVTTKFLYDGTRLIAEYNGSNALLRRYVHGDGVDDPIVWYDSSGTTNKRNLFKDERGSVIAADTGSAVTSLKYDEYGNATVTGSAAPRFRYTGQAWLPELGLYYYKARIYNPDLGRFMQTDPIGTEDQVNLYAYVGNDPFNKTDPTGKCPLCLVIPAVCAGGGCEALALMFGLTGYVAVKTADDLSKQAPPAMPMESSGSKPYVTPGGHEIRDHGKKGDGEEYIKGKGHTPDSIDAILADATEAYPTAKGDHRRDEPATAHKGADGEWVITNDVTGDVIAVSDRNNPRENDPPRKPDEDPMDGIKQDPFSGY